MRSRALPAIALSAFMSLALAQPRLPTDDEIERAKQQYRQPTDAEVEAARKRYRAPTRAELDRAASSQSPVNVDAMPKPEGAVDVEGLVRAYEAHRDAFERSRSFSVGEPTLLVFVTLAMPDEALRRLCEQASRAHAVLVLRGLQNASIRQTAARVQQLIGERRVEWLIDPEAFDRFAIHQAPTFVLVKADAATTDCASGSCVAPDAFASITGDVSLDYALQAIERRAPRFTPETQRFVQRMRGEGR